MQGTIAGIVIKREHRGPLVCVEEATVSAKGIEGNVPSSGPRRVTFIANAQWAETMADLGADLPWHTRRANVLLDGLRAPDLVGKVLQIGDIEIQVNGETEPCERMDEIHQGLRKALEPDLRGGVYGSVLRGGTLRIGDTVRVAAQSKE